MQNELAILALASWGIAAFAWTYLLVRDSGGGMTHTYKQPKKESPNA